MKALRLEKRMRRELERAEVMPVSHTTLSLAIQFQMDLKGYTDWDLLNRYISDNWEFICKLFEAEPFNFWFNNIDYYIREICRNAIEYACNGRLYITISDDRISIRVTDMGNGIPSKEIHTYLDPDWGHGLWQTFKFAHTFRLTSQGVTYKKEDGKLVRSKLRTSVSRTDQFGCDITFSLYNMILKDLTEDWHRFEHAWALHPSLKCSLRLYLTVKFLQEIRVTLLDRQKNELSLIHCAECEDREVVWIERENLPAESCYLRVESEDTIITKKLV